MITLKIALRANATSCIIFGLTFLLIPLKVALFLGGEAAFPDTLIIFLGIVLLVNGAHLFWASSKASPNKYLILYFSAGDFVWALCSIILLLLGVGITTTLGIIVTILVAVMVTTFAILQIIKRRDMCNEE